MESSGATGTQGHALAHGLSNSLSVQQRVRGHLVLRHDPPRWPFVWRGLLPVLGLLGLAWYGVAPFARQDIEATVLRETQSGLVSAGHAWVQTTVSGQEVVLRGTPPAAGAGDQALAAARAAQCPDWLGQHPCATSVVGDFAAPTTAPPAPAPAPPPPDKAAIDACDQSFKQLLSNAKVEFETGSALLRASSQTLLDQLATAARACPGALQIEGHTDSRGAADANQRLSEARAESVRQALVARGLPAERLKALGYGAGRPLGDNATEAGRAHNRRIELRSAAAN